MIQEKKDNNMARFFKHVGEHNGKKVVIVEKSIPGEDHMCAVIYTSIIPTRFHDEIMQLLETPEGQAEKEFGMILHRRMSDDGRTILQAIAQEGFLKKAPANQVIVKPNASSAIRLDELNKLLREAGEGQHAIDRLEQLDREAGIRDPIKIAEGKRMAEAAALKASQNDALDDKSIAQNYLAQAMRMRNEADTLIAESKRLEDEAAKLSPKTVKPKATRGKKKVTA